jgi:hypothetical protein
VKIFVLKVNCAKPTTFKDVSKEQLRRWHLRQTHKKRVDGAHAARLNRKEIWVSSAAEERKANMFICGNRKDKDD